MKIRPRFSLRTLLIVVGLAGCLMGWVTYHLNWIRQRHAVFANRRIYGKEFWKYTRVYQPPRNAPWPLRIFGEPGCPDLALDLAESDAELARIRSLFPEAHVDGK